MVALTISNIKRKEFFIQILKQNQQIKTIRFILLEPLKCIFCPVNIKPKK